MRLLLPHASAAMTFQKLESKIKHDGKTRQYVAENINFLFEIVKYRVKYVKTKKDRLKKQIVQKRLINIVNIFTYEKNNISLINYNTLQCLLK